MDQATFTYQYKWVGISSLADKLLLAHCLNKVLHVEWHRQSPLAVWVDDKKKDMFPMYVSASSEQDQEVILLLQNTKVSPESVSPLLSFNFFLLLPKQHPNAERLSTLLLEIEQIFDCFVLPEYNTLNKNYKTTIDILAETLEVYFLEQKLDDGLQSWMW